MKINEEIKSDFQMIASSIKNINLKNDFYMLPDPERLSFIADAEYDKIHISKNEDGGFAGTIDLTVTATAKLKKSKDKISIKMCIMGIFVDSKAETEEAFEQFLTLNGCATLYAIARSIIIGLSSQSMSSGELILPMVNFFKMKKVKEEKEFEKSE